MRARIAKPHAGRGASSALIAPGMGLRAATGEFDCASIAKASSAAQPTEEPQISIA